MVSDKLPPCADDVFKNGVSACLVGDVPKHAAETICQSLSAVTGWKIDWHYFGGRTHIKALAPAPQPHPEPIAWMVGTAFWWTKEEAERDASATGLLMVPVGPLTVSAEAEQHQGDPVVLPARLPQRMPQGRNLPRNYAEAWNACLTEVEKLGPLYPRAVPGEGDRLSKATAFVQRLVDCAGTQPSVATGYLRDILDELKGNTTPTAPVAHNENAAFESWARSRLTPLNLRLDEIGLYHDLVAGTAHDAWQARAALEIKAS